MEKIKVLFICHGNICRIVYKRKVDMRLNLI
nr:MAG TPA: LMWPTP protein [Caudoviricetes sp.]